MKNNINKRCCNCGKIGHLYKQCKEPKTSLGIISFKIDKKKIKYLMVRRKKTHGYVEFLRGKYDINDSKFLQRIINEMTLEEKYDILNDTFDKLWKKLWIKTDITLYSNIQMNDYRISKSKFLQLKKHDTNNLKQFIEKSKTKWIEPEWGFPKGRRKIKENDLDCAKREFMEETGLKMDDFKINKNISPKIENITGTNNIKYKHIYYIAELKKDINLRLDSNNFEQISEIGDIGCFSYDECLELIRPYNLEKKNILSDINKIIQK